MGLDASTSVRNLLAALGARYPAGDEDGYHAAGRFFRLSALAVLALTPELINLVNQVLNGIDTQVSTPFAQAMSDFYDGPNYLGVTADGYNALGDISDESGNELLQSKVYSISIATGLLAQLLVDMALEAFFPEFMEEVMAAVIAIAESLLRTRIGVWLVKLAIQAAMGVIIQEQFDVVTQLVSIKVLHIQDSWNWSETGVQALVGLLGAGMGLGLVPLERVLTSKLDGFLTRLLQLDKKDVPGDGDPGLPDPGKDMPEPSPKDVPEPELPPVPEPRTGSADGPDVVHESEPVPEPAPQPLPEPEPRPEPEPEAQSEPQPEPEQETESRPVDGLDQLPAPERGPGGQDPVRPEDIPLPPPEPGELDPPEPSPAFMSVKDVGPPGPGKPAIGSPEWWVQISSEIPSAILIGGVHNAGHETLFNMWTTGSGSWNWSTFSGGSAQALKHPIGVLSGGHIRLITTLPISAHDLLAGALGSITPQMLNELKAAGNPVNSNALLAGDTAAGASGTGQGVNRPFGTGPGDQVSGGGGHESDAVSILRAAQVPINDETVYQVALHDGLVPTVGPAANHPAYANEVTVRLPPFKSASSFRPSEPSAPVDSVLTPPVPTGIPAITEPQITGVQLPAGLDQSAGQNQVTQLSRPLTPPPEEQVAGNSALGESLAMPTPGQSAPMQEGAFGAQAGELPPTPPATPPLSPADQQPVGTQQHLPGALTEPQQQPPAALAEPQPNQRLPQTSEQQPTAGQQVPHAARQEASVVPEKAPAVPEDAPLTETGPPVVVSGKAPVVTQIAPVVTQTAPVVTGAALPVTGTAQPVTDNAPVVTETAQTGPPVVVSGKASVVPETALPVSEIPVVVSGKALGEDVPVVSGDVPVVSGAAPVVTEAPVVAGARAGRPGWVAPQAVVPGGGAWVRSGMVLGEKRGGVSRAELVAADAFGEVDGALFVYVHTKPVGAGGDPGVAFLVDGRELTADELNSDVLAGLGLPEGMAVFLVACGAGAGGVDSAAARVSEVGPEFVFGMSVDAFTTAAGDVVSVEPGLDGAGRPVLADLSRPGQVVLFRRGVVAGEFGHSVKGLLAEGQEALAGQGLVLRPAGVPGRAPGFDQRWAGGLPRGLAAPAAFTGGGGSGTRGRLAALNGGGDGLPEALGASGSDAQIVTNVLSVFPAAGPGSARPQWADERAGMREVLTQRLKKLGPRRFGLLLLTGGVSGTVQTARGPERVRIWLDADPARARELAPGVAAQVVSHPIGSREWVPSPLMHESAAEESSSSSSGRQMGGQGYAYEGLGSADSPRLVFGGAGGGASSGRSAGRSAFMAAQSWRGPTFPSGDDVYFELPGAVLRAQVQLLDGKGLPSADGPVPAQPPARPVRAWVGFPVEAAHGPGGVTPAAQPGPVIGVQEGQPLPVADSRVKLGLNEALGRVHAVVLDANISAVRRDVVAQVERRLRDAGLADSGDWREVFEEWLMEPDVLEPFTRLWGTFGLVSPLAGAGGEHVWGQLTAQLWSVRRTGTAHMPVKMDARRPAGGAGSSGSVSGSRQMTGALSGGGYMVSEDSDPEGTIGQYSYAEGNFSPGEDSGSAHDWNANVVHGEWRPIVIQGDKAVYQARVSFTTQLHAGHQGLDGPVVTPERWVTVLVPADEAPLFEQLVAEAVQPAAQAGGQQAVPAGGQQAVPAGGVPLVPLPAPGAPPAGPWGHPVPLQDGGGQQAAQVHPPEPVADGTGLGSSSVTLAPRLEQAAGTAWRLIKDAEGALRGWMPGRSVAQEWLLARLVSGVLGHDMLIARQAELLASGPQPGHGDWASVEWDSRLGGVTLRVTRKVPGGLATTWVVVRPVRAQPGPVGQGQIGLGSAGLYPIAFFIAGTGTQVSSSWSAGAGADGQLGIQGFSPGSRWAWFWPAAGGVLSRAWGGRSGSGSLTFDLRGYRMDNAPLSWFDYAADFHVDVFSELRTGPARALSGPMGLLTGITMAPQLAWRGVQSGWGSARELFTGRRPGLTPVPAVVRQTRSETISGGGLRYVLPQAMTRSTAPVPGAVKAGELTGLTPILNAAGPRSWLNSVLGRAPAQLTPPPAWITAPALMGKSDLLLGFQGSGAVARQLTRMLTAAGVPEEAAGTTGKALADPMQLAAVFMRTPDGQAGLHLFAPQLTGDLLVQVGLRLGTYNQQAAVTDPATGHPVVVTGPRRFEYQLVQARAQSSHGTATTESVWVNLPLAWQVGDVGGGKQFIEAAPGLTGDWTQATETAQSVSSYSGSFDFFPPGAYAEYLSDVVATMVVVVTHTGAAGVVMPVSALISHGQINKGLSFLRPVDQTVLNLVAPGTAASPSAASTRPWAAGDPPPAGGAPAQLTQSQLPKIAAPWLVEFPRDAQGRYISPTGVPLTLPDGTPLPDGITPLAARVDELLPAELKEVTWEVTGTATGGTVTGLAKHTDITTRQLLDAALTGGWDMMRGGGLRAKTPTKDGLLSSTSASMVILMDMVQVDQAGNVVRDPATGQPAEGTLEYLHGGSADGWLVSRFWNTVSKTVTSVTQAHSSGTKLTGRALQTEPASDGRHLARLEESLSGAWKRAGSQTVQEGETTWHEDIFEWTGLTHLYQGWAQVTVTVTVTRDPSPLVSRHLGPLAGPVVRGIASGLGSARDYLATSRPVTYLTSLPALSYFRPAQPPGTGPRSALVTQKLMVPHAGLDAAVLPSSKLLARLPRPAAGHRAVPLPGTGGAASVTAAAMRGVNHRPTWDIPDRALNLKHVQVIDIEHGALRELQDNIVADMTAAGMGRVVQEGTATFGQIATALSWTFMTGNMPAMLHRGRDAGLSVLRGYRPGGAGTDDVVDFTLHAKLLRGTRVVHGTIPGEVQEEHYTLKSRSGAASSADTSAERAGLQAPDQLTGDRATTEVFRHEFRRGYPGGGGSITQTTGQSQAGTDSRLQGSLRLHFATWVHVTTTMIVAVQAKLTNHRDGAVISNQAAQIFNKAMTGAYQLDRSAEIAVDPEYAREFGLDRQVREGMPITAGRYFPSATHTTSHVRAAHAMPLLSANPAAFTPPADQDWFHPQQRDFYQAVFDYHPAEGRAEIGYNYPAGTAFPAGFTAPQGHPGTFSGGSRVTALEFAAHLYGTGDLRAGLPVALVTAGTTTPMPGQPGRTFAGDVAVHLTRALGTDPVTGRGTYVLGSRSGSYHTPIGGNQAASFGHDTSGRSAIAQADPATAQPATAPVPGQWDLLDDTGQPVPLGPPNPDMHATIAAIPPHLGLAAHPVTDPGRPHPPSPFQYTPFGTTPGAPHPLAGNTHNTNGNNGSTTIQTAPPVTQTAPPTVTVTAPPVVTVTAPPVVTVTDTAPAVTETAPVVTAPVVTDTATAVTETAPVVTAPVVSDTATAVTQTAPVVKDTAPVVTATAAAVTGTGPEMTESPAVPEDAPVVPEDDISTEIGPDTIPDAIPKNGNGKDSPHRKHHPRPIVYNQQ